MAHFVELSGDQVRQLINAEQAYAAFRAAKIQLRQRFRGSMAWKRVSGRQYLYRKVAEEWKSLGPRGEATELALDSFRAGRAALRERVAALNATIVQMAPVNRAMRLGRVPRTAARILRRLETGHLLGHGISVVDTHALFAYERMAGGHLASSQVSTADIDLLYDARAKVKLLAPALKEQGLQGLLQRADGTFEMISPGGFRAVNAAGFMVDLIMPMARRPAHGDGGKNGEGGKIGMHPSDMNAAEIEGLAWLQNSPQIEQTVLDERGYPLRIAAPDPRAFALHKLWLSERADRDRIKRARDAWQAEAVAALVSRFLPQLRFDGADLAALPEALRMRVPELLAKARLRMEADETDW